MCKSDRELLELAAKAAGLAYEWNSCASCGIQYIPKGLTRYVDWAPLNDDGDALRLAVKLGFGISFGQYAPLDVYSVYISKVEGGDTLAVGCITDGDEFGVVRRAIVRAAAAIGRSLS